MSSSPSPSENLAQLVAELRSLRQHHGLRDPARLARTPTLLAVTAEILGAVAVDAADVPPAARQLLCEVIAELGGEDTTAASAAYGLGPGHDAPTLTQRRSDLAEVFGLTTRTLQRHEERIIETIAFRLLERVQIVRAAKAPSPARLHEAGGVSVDWLSRFEAYYRIWSDLSGLANDLDAYYRQRSEPVPDRDPASYFASSLWYYARFLVHLDRFQYEHGGLWLFTDAETEAAVTDTIYRIVWHAPTSDLDDSWLRTVLTLAPAEELGFFLDQVNEFEDGRDVLAEWSKWISCCVCTETEPLESCEPHRVIALCRSYCEIVDREWRRVAGWYRGALQHPNT